MSVAIAGGLLGLTAGPWLRVRTVSYAGAGWTPHAELDAVMEPIVGRSALLVDTTSLELELGDLPAVERASVEVGLFGEAQVALVEGRAAAVWRTSAAQLLMADDGTVVGVLSLTATPGGKLGQLPVIEDLRDASHDLSVGDAIPASELDAAVALAALPASRLGSQAAVLSLALDPTYGFVLSSPQSGWRAAFGFYGLDPSDTAATMAARIAAQASAVRTLFASHPEAAVAWVDARNPGRVYFRARG
ncbi:MAG: cell division protein FtsQ/DivIB [Candidatus Limnocylindria bacterium]